jgi:phosphoglycolate phosphatase-like HAD superfamily hydrolase
MMKNLLWDLDGTLFDAYPAITYANSKSISQMGGAMAEVFLSKITGK